MKSSRRSRSTTNVDWYLKRLKDQYPDAHCALHHSNPLELLVATVLSAQCTDERVNKVTPALFARFPTAADYAGASLGELEELVKSTGFYKNKAKALKGLGEKLKSDHGGEVPRTMEELIKLPGVGRKTANVVLGNAFHIASGIVVDTHVGRLSRRLGLTRQKTPEKVEQDLLRQVPLDDWVLFSHLLISHGRGPCQARKPTCQTCFLQERCPKIGVTFSKKRG